MSREYRGSIIAEADFERRETRLNEILVRGWREDKGEKGRAKTRLYFFYEQFNGIIMKILLIERVKSNLR